jgi:peroxiredoxin
MEDLSSLEGANGQVLGISVDSRWTHYAFKQKLGLKYPLLADFHPKGAVAEKYGLYHADKGNYCSRHGDRRQGRQGRLDQGRAD